MPTARVMLSASHRVYTVPRCGIDAFATATVSLLEGPSAEKVAAWEKATAEHDALGNRHCLRDYVTDEYPRQVGGFTEVPPKESYD